MIARLHAPPRAYTGLHRIGLLLARLFVQEADDTSERQTQDVHRVDAHQKSRHRVHFENTATRIGADHAVARLRGEPAVWGSAIEQLAEL